MISYWWEWVWRNNNINHDRPNAINLPFGDGQFIRTIWIHMAPPVAIARWEIRSSEMSGCTGHRQLLNAWEPRQSAWDVETGHLMAVFCRYLYTCIHICTCIKWCSIINYYGYIMIIYWTWLKWFMGTSRNCMVAKDIAAMAALKCMWSTVKYSSYHVLPQSAGLHGWIGWSKTMSPKDGDADIVVNVKDGSSSGQSWMIYFL